MRWKIILYSNLEYVSQDLLESSSKLEKYCEIVPTNGVEETIENFLYMQSEIVIVCSDVSSQDLKKLKKVLHHINNDLVIIENFEFGKYNVQEEIKRAIRLYNTSNSDLFSTKFSHN